MSTSQGIQTTTGNKTVTAGRDATIINLDLTTNSTPENKPRVWKPFCTVQAPTPNFTGREDLIATVHRQIQYCSKETEYSKNIVVIHGLGGMGKSELVRKYVQMYRQNIINAAWIDAQSKNSLESSFKSLAEELYLQTKNKDVKDVVSSVYKHLSDHRQPSLFIFDNAEQMRSEDNVFGVFDFLPTVQLHTNPLIIITTRVNNWELPEENILQINELSEDAGVKFLTTRWRLSAGQKNDEKITDALKDLARNLQCFPLGLTLAASNIPRSKLRSIPKEIEDYIRKLNGPHEGWIKERHSAGTVSKYDLIMNNVWAATLEKIQLRGHTGKAAISILNIIAYLLPDEITVEKVVKVAQFSGLPTSTEGFEMLELYSLISLPSCTNDCIYCRYGKHQRIRIHRLVQRCTRDKLDREKNYICLLNIVMFVARQKQYIFDSQSLHQHLKERMWPKNSIHFSILFASKDLIRKRFEILKDVHEGFVLKVKPVYVQNCKEDYKILHVLNLYYMSVRSYASRELWRDLISFKDPFYSGNYPEQVFLSTLGKCVQDLFMGTMDMEDLVKRATIDVLILTLKYHTYGLTSFKSKEVFLMITDITGNSFEGIVGTVGLLYQLLCGIDRCYKPVSDCWYVKVVLKIHGSVYASISESGGDRLDSYWENDNPIPYSDILRKLTDNSNAEWTLCFVESFRAEAGRQFLLESLQFLDTLTKTKMPHNACKVLDFIIFLGWKWDWTKEFVQADHFMQTLYSFTKNIFKFNIKRCLANQFQCLMVWFGLFGKNTPCLDRNGVSWSIQSVEKEMKLFLEMVDGDGRSLQAYFTWNGNAKDVLSKFIESSRSDQESIAVKTALRMQNWLN